MPKVTLVLADDHHIVRQGLRAILETAPTFDVIGEAAHGLDVVPLVCRLRPDVLLLDLMMPGLNGLDITTQVREQCPDTKVIILSMHRDEAYVVQALRNGAAGYVLKEANYADLVQAVHEVAVGRRYLSPPLSEESLRAYEHRVRHGAFDLYETLTAREREILHLTAEGLSSTEVAARLFISSRTVETHRTNLMRKLGLHTQGELIRYALRRGILPLSD
ncbi:MAG: response regulator transcription factor [Abitibacteriaceae bacterium]|nr:response regulator transcription factor [Abditibacteriaceae bacterium]MBV9864617.1 response regulator transcription factor [Abditibacteriaceae bacterium]